MRLLLSDAHWRTAQYVAQSLRRAGYPVVGLTAVPLGQAAQHFAEVLPVPDSGREPDSWLQALGALTRDGDTFVPISMETLALLEQRRDELPPALRLPPPNGDAFFQASDKERSVALMQALGVRVPHTACPASEEEAQESARTLGYPIVVKLREERNIPPQERYAIVRDAAAFGAAYRRLAARQPCPLVQEYVVGGGVGVSLLADRGKVLALFAHERLREQLAEGGPSTDCRGITNAELEAVAHRFAEATGWNGVAMLEFKRHPHTGELVFMEINPRFWGSLELAIRSGVDFPLWYVRWIHGERPPDPLPLRSRQPARLKYLELDVSAFARTLRTLPSLPARVGATVSYLREFRDPSLQVESRVEREPWLARAIHYAKLAGQLIRYVV